MSESPFRFRWRVPQCPFALFRLRWSIKDFRLRGKMTPSFDPPQEVLAPVELDQTVYAEVTRSEKDRAQLVRGLEVLDPSNVEAVIRYLSKWGFLVGSPDSLFGGRPRCEHELAACFEAPDSEPLADMPPLPDEAVAVPYVRVAHVAQPVRIYQNAVERYRALPGLRGEAKRNETERLRKLCLDQLSRYGGSERDPETFLPLIGSPLATAWQHLAESAAEGIVPVRCERCARPFTLTKTDKRRDKPPRHCSNRCRLAAWRKRRKTGKGRKAPKRRGRT